jgi:hypothetical protein
VPRTSATRLTWTFVDGSGLRDPASKESEQSVNPLERALNLAGTKSERPGKLPGQVGQSRFGTGQAFAVSAISQVGGMAQQLSRVFGRGLSMLHSLLSTVPIPVLTALGSRIGTGVAFSTPHPITAARHTHDFDQSRPVVSGLAQLVSRRICSRISAVRAGGAAAMNSRAMTLAYWSMSSRLSRYSAPVSCST